MPVVPIFLRMGGLLSLPCKSLGPGLQNAQPNPAHSIANNKEVLYPRIPHTVVARPGASDHRDTSQMGEDECF